MNFTYTIAALLLLAVAAVCSWRILRNRKSILDRLPLLLMLPVLILLLLFKFLPEIAPGVFAHFLHHSINDQVNLPTVNGITESENWWLTWDNENNYLLPLTIIVGILWAISNVIRGRDRLLNCVALLLGMGFIYLLLMAIGASMFP